MKKLLPIKLVSIIFLMISSYFTPIFSNSITIFEKHNSLDFEEYSFVSIQDFTNFEIFTDVVEINSTKTNSTINFSYIESNPTLNITTEQYLLSLLKNGNCSDFEISLKIDLNYTFSILGEFFIILESVFNEFGEYPYSSDECCICKIAVSDFSHEIGMKYSLSAFPNGVLSTYYLSEENSIQTGELQFNLSRKKNVLNCFIKQESNLKINHTWFKGVSKPLNYVYLGYSNIPLIAEEANLQITALNSRFNCSGIQVVPPVPQTPTVPSSTEPQTMPFPMNPLIWLGSFIGLIVMGFFFTTFIFFGKEIKNKKNNEKKR